ncbi:MAG TPA: RecX family transcriptional regulator [Rubricoccaceae bacterium]|jgi:regulatory protein
MSFQTQRRERPDPAALDLADGTVTRVAQQAKDPERASIYIDERFAFGLAVDLVIAAGLRKGVALTAAEQRDLLVRQESYGAKSAALSYVSDQARTTEEVRRNLTQKGFAESIVDDAVEGLAAVGLLDDAAYAEAYARSRFSGRGHGPARIRQDLQRRGVPRAAIDAALDTLVETEDLAERATEDAAAKWRSLRSEPDRRKRTRKTMDFLVRRGHSFDVARAAADAAAEADPPGDDAEDVAWDE